MVDRGYGAGVQGEGSRGVGGAEGGPVRAAAVGGVLKVCCQGRDDEHRSGRRKREIIVYGCICLAWDCRCRSDGFPVLEAEIAGCGGYGPEEECGVRLGGGYDEAGWGMEGCGEG